MHVAAQRPPTPEGGRQGVDLADGRAAASGAGFCRDTRNPD